MIITYLWRLCIFCNLSSCLTFWLVLFSFLWCLEQKCLFSFLSSWMLVLELLFVSLGCWRQQSSDCLWNRPELGRLRLKTLIPACCTPARQLFGSCWPRVTSELCPAVQTVCFCHTWTRHFTHFLLMLRRKHTVTIVSAFPLWWSSLCSSCRRYIYYSFMVVGVYGILILTGHVVIVLVYL